MSGLDSKLRMAETFASLVEHTSLERVTIDMVTDCIGKHRKTFYYHFSHKGEVIIWLFRYDLAQALKAVFPANLLVYESQDDSAYPALPFYVRNIKPTGRIYNAPFFDELSHIFENRRDYYRKVLSYHGQGSLEDYLYRLYCPEIKRDITLIIKQQMDRKDLLACSLEQELLNGDTNIDFLTEFFTGAFIQRLIKQLLDEPSQRTLEEIKPYENVIHDSLLLLIKQAIHLYKQPVR